MCYITNASQVATSSIDWKGFYLNSGILQRKNNTVDTTECFTSCIQHTDCRSFSYNTATKLCIVNNITRLEVPTLRSVVDSSTFDYTHFPDVEYKDTKDFVYYEIVA